MYMVFFRVFSPKNPTVNTHNRIVEINQTFTVQSPVKIQIYIQKRRNNSSRIYPNVSFHGKENTGNSQKCRNAFQDDLKVFVGCIGFYEVIDDFVHNNYSTSSTQTR